MAIARACWTGRPRRAQSEWYALPADVVCLPTPGTRRSRSSSAAIRGRRCGGQVGSATAGSRSSRCRRSIPTSCGRPQRSIRRAAAAAGRRDPDALAGRAADRRGRRPKRRGRAGSCRARRGGRRRDHRRRPLGRRRPCTTRPVLLTRRPRHEPGWRAARGQDGGRHRRRNAGSARPSRASSRPRARAARCSTSRTAADPPAGWDASRPTSATMHRSPRVFDAVSERRSTSSSRRRASCPPGARLARLDLGEWDEVLRVNVRGVASTLLHALPAAARWCVDRRDRVAQRVEGGSEPIAYTASKHAVLGLVRSAALDLGRRGIRVNAIAPGPVATDALLARHAAPRGGARAPVDEALAAAAAQTALGRIATVDEVARRGALPRERPLVAASPATCFRSTAGSRDGRPDRQDGPAHRRLARASAQRPPARSAPPGANSSRTTAPTARAPRKRSPGSPTRASSSCRPTSRIPAPAARALARGGRVARPHRRRRRQRRDRAGDAVRRLPTRTGTRAGSRRSASTCSSRRA